ncbi:heavy-metal-associated domain-containing protein [Acinetobacter larvae]|uniref:Heavy metal transporter n=1 Tax=Acinetobacter larvae TaxID=1789224 RepID=A0A1B2M0S4_9GAMM|nr:heavy-metal-associated domain-containing protein [Acinetobacter larvae]AOA58775.1 heavy metal transporter [Acinetobacter larvae]
MQLYIENMTCGGCARGVTATIKAVDPAAQVEIDVEKKLVSLQSQADLEVILAALAEDAFPAVPR